MKQHWIRLRFPSCILWDSTFSTCCQNKVLRQFLLCIYQHRQQHPSFPFDRRMVSMRLLGVLLLHIPRNNRSVGWNSLPQQLPVTFCCVFHWVFSFPKFWKWHKSIHGRYFNWRDSTIRASGPSIQILIEGRWWTRVFVGFWGWGFSSKFVREFLQKLSHLSCSHWTTSHRSYPWRYQQILLGLIASTWLRLTRWLEHDLIGFLHRSYNWMDCLRTSMILISMSRGCCEL